MASLKHCTPSTFEVIRPAKRHKPSFVSGLSLSSHVKFHFLLMLQHKPAAFSSVLCREIDFFSITVLKGTHLLCLLVCLKTVAEPRVSAWPLDSCANAKVNRSIRNTKTKWHTKGLGLLVSFLSCCPLQHILGYVLFLQHLQPLVTSGRRFAISLVLDHKPVGSLKLLMSAAVRSRL